MLSGEIARKNNHYYYYLAQGHNILMPGFEPSTSVSINRHSNHMNNMLYSTILQYTLLLHTVQTPTGGSYHALVIGVVTEMILDVLDVCLLVRTTKLNYFINNLNLNIIIIAY